MKVLTSDEAHNNISEIYENSLYYSIKYANKIVKFIYTSIYELEHSPYLGRYVPEVSDKSLREIICGSYRIVYEILENSNILYIHFIIHAKRDFNSFYKSYFKNNL